MNKSIASASMRRPKSKHTNALKHKSKPSSLLLLAIKRRDAQARFYCLTCYFVLYIFNHSFLVKIVFDTIEVPYSKAIKSYLYVIATFKLCASCNKKVRTSLRNYIFMIKKHLLKSDILIANGHYRPSIHCDFANKLYLKL